MYRTWVPNSVYLGQTVACEPFSVHPSLSGERHRPSLGILDILGAAHVAEGRENHGSEALSECQGIYIFRQLDLHLGNMSTSVAYPTKTETYRCEASTT